LGVVLVSILAILTSVAALVILFTFENEAAQFISGGDPQQFYKQLRVELMDDYGEVYGIAHNSGNTISATVDALVYGADIIEIDVVLVHGELHAAHWSPFRFVGSRFFRGPTLAEVWGAADQAEVVKLDLKRASTEMVDSLLTFLADRRRANNEIVVVSDEPEALALLHQQEPGIILMLGVGGSSVLSDLFSGGDLLRVIDGVSVRHSLLTVDSVGSLKEKGLIVFAWTVNDAATMNELVEYGVDGIITDNLAIMQLLGAE
jgi:glycerophosphoryl diester phosphodiesterase